MAITRKLMDHLAGFDTPTICNALEITSPDRRAVGFSTKPFVCAWPKLKPIVGFARTATISALKPGKLTGAAAKEQRLEYYAYVSGTEDEPTITVLQDIDPEPGFGAFWGEVNTAVHRGLGCLGCITNGSIRDMDVIAPGFQLIAGVIGPSHAWVHLEELKVPVTIHGMAVKHGDLIHADQHGAVVIPLDAAERLPDAIDLCTRKEAPILAAARTPGFNVEKLRAAFGTADDIH